jgi:hypothetical protein
LKCLSDCTSRGGIELEAREPHPTQPNSEFPPYKGIKESEAPVRYQPAHVDQRSAAGATSVYISVFLCDVAGLLLERTRQLRTHEEQLQLHLWKRAGGETARIAEVLRTGTNADLNSLIPQLAPELLPEVQIAAPARGSADSADDVKGLVSRENALLREALKDMSARLAMIERR